MQYSLIQLQVDNTNGIYIAQTADSEKQPQEVWLTFC